MLKSYRIVLLSDFDPSLHVDINFSKSSVIETVFLNDADRLQIPSIIDGIGGFHQLQAETLIAVAVYYRMLPQGGCTEILGDVSDSHQAVLAELLASYVTVERVGDLIVVKGALENQLAVKKDQGDLCLRQELEMLLYEHPINQHRLSRQLRPISGILFLKVKRPKQLPKVVSQNPLMKMMAKTETLSSWAKKPTPQTIVLGGEVGDQEVYALAQMMTTFLASGRAWKVTVIDGTKTRVYYGNLFVYLVERMKQYFGF